MGTRPLLGKCGVSGSLDAHPGGLPAIKEAIFLDAAADFGRSFEAILADFSPDASANVPIPQDPNATCLMIYTSGTTGRPKGAELTHGNLTATLDGLHEAWGWREDDVLLHVLPIVLVEPG